MSSRTWCLIPPVSHTKRPGTYCLPKFTVVACGLKNVSVRSVAGFIFFFCCRVDITTRRRLLGLSVGEIWLWENRSSHSTEPTGN